MKRLLIASALALILAISLCALPVNGMDLGYSDPTGDVENEGMEANELPDIDIKEVMVTVGADTVTIELTVAGTIIYGEEDLPFHQYRFFFDLDGDLETDVFIDLDTFTDTYTIDVDDGVFESILDKLSGNGTSKLTVTLPATWFGDMSSYDLEAEATTGDLFNYADDEVNDDFEGGTPIGDDDDDDTVIDDDDDTEPDDDDTTTDDDDDTVTDDDDDDSDDDPGFELVLIIPALLITVGIAYQIRKRRN